MPYSAEISRTNPTALVILLDQSSSMLEPFDGQPEKSEAGGVADAPNRLLAAAKADRFPVGPKSRGFVFNADLAAVIRFLDVGTRVAQSVR